MNPRGAILSIVHCALLALPLSAQDRLQYDVEAAYLLNFTKFVEWPPASFDGDAPFRICVAGPDPFGDALAKIVEGERVNSRPLVIQELGREPPSHCQIVFFGKSEKNVAETIAHLEPGVLTVGEADDFLRLGGVIDFVLRNNRVRFDVNQTAARKAGLKISSRLLTVALHVEGE